MSVETVPHRFVCGDIIEVIYGNGADRHYEGVRGRLEGRIGPGKSKAQIELRNRNGYPDGRIVVDTANIKLFKSVKEIEEQARLERQFEDEDEEY